MSAIVDPEAILSMNEEWTKLEEEWGIPVDLETEEDYSPSKMTPVFSSLDLRRTTFDSSFLLKKVRQKVGRTLSKTDVLDYKQFLQDLEREAVKDIPVKQFYYINGQIISAMSVEDICEIIDNIFQSIDKLTSATSTIRLKRKIPEHVSCSISAGGLSFDDTKLTEDEKDSEKEKSDSDDIDRFIDEAFQQLSVTVASICEDDDDDISRESVTTLVKRFSSILNNPALKRSPKKRRMCCDRFKELAEFWNNKALDN